MTKQLKDLEFVSIESFLKDNPLTDEETFTVARLRVHTLASVVASVMENQALFNQTGVFCTLRCKELFEQVEKHFENGTKIPTSIFHAAYNITWVGDINILDNALPNLIMAGELMNDTLIVLNLENKTMAVLVSKNDEDEDDEEMSEIEAHLVLAQTVMSDSFIEFKKKASVFMEQFQAGEITEAELEKHLKELNLSDDSTYSMATAKKVRRALKVLNIKKPSWQEAVESGIETGELKTSEEKEPKNKKSKKKNLQDLISPDSLDFIKGLDLGF